MTEVPILYLVFNRLDLVQQSFPRIREAAPKNLYIAADGPRPGNENDAKLCPEVRTYILQQVDWECEVHTLFRESNLGCGKAVSQAITWFFQEVEHGIILEDDCLPDPSFFTYCADLLEKYSMDKRVFQIAGSNWQKGKKRGKGDYYFSALSSVWGWATWRDRWAQYDFEFGQDTDWETVKTNLALASSSAEEAAYHMKCFMDTRDGKIDTWDYQWRFLMFLNKGLNIVPQVNLVTNIGFDERGTHTSDVNHWRAGLASQGLNFPLTHPSKVEQDKNADAFLAEHVWFANKPKKQEGKHLLGRLIKFISK